MTDPTPEEIEAAAKILYDTDNVAKWNAPEFRIAYLDRAKAALIATAKVRLDLP